MQVSGLLVEATSYAANGEGHANAIAGTVSVLILDSEFEKDAGTATACSRQGWPANGHSTTSQLL